MHILRKALGGNSEFESRTSILRSEDAAVARHQGADEFTKRLLVPSPRNIRETLNLRLLAPKIEFLQPTNEGVRPPRVSGFIFAETGDNVVRPVLPHMTRWEIGRDGIFKVSDYFGIYVDEFGRITRKSSVTHEVPEQARQPGRHFIFTEDR